MLGFKEGIGDDLLGLEVMQIDDRYALVGLSIDKPMPAILLTLLFRKGRVMGITIGDVLTLNSPSGQYRL